MIPRAFIFEWQRSAPSQTNAQIEQDLVIERALIELFSNKLIRENLAFRGGTALHKLFLKPQARYSEDKLGEAGAFEVVRGKIKQLCHSK